MSEQFIDFIRYHVPSESGSLDPEDCQFIWVWYGRMAKGADEYRNLFTGVSGKRYWTTIPRDELQSEVWSLERKIGEALSAPFSELLAKTPDHLLSAVRECSLPRAGFHDGKLLFVGDAFALFRPLVGFSMDQAAMQALKLAEVFNGKCNRAEWETKSLACAKKKNQD